MQPPSGSARAKTSATAATHYRHSILYPTVACRTSETSDWQFPRFLGIPHRALRKWSISMILAAFRRGRNTSNMPALYGAIVAQARLPVFYTLYGVEDTVEGRFELIVLHMVLLLRRLARKEGRSAAGGGSFDKALGQPLFD